MFVKCINEFDEKSMAFSVLWRRPWACANAGFRQHVRSGSKEAAGSEMRWCLVKVRTSLCFFLVVTARSPAAAQPGYFRRPLQSLEPCLVLMGFPGVPLTALALNFAKPLNHCGGDLNLGGAFQGPQFWEIMFFSTSFCFS